MGRIGRLMAPVLAAAVALAVGFAAAAPAVNIATTASFPIRESTESLMAPFWMYLTSLPASPCEKTTPPRRYFTILRAGPVDSRYVPRSNPDRIFGSTACAFCFMRLT